MPMTIEDRQIIEDILKKRGWVEIDGHWVHLGHDLPMTLDQACRQEGIKYLVGGYNDLLQPPLSNPSGLRIHPRR